MASSDAGTERIEDVSVKGENLVVEPHISEDPRRNLSFSDVHPVNIAVRNLDVDVELTTSFVNTLKTKFIKSDDAENRAVGVTRGKKILRDVSADFPAGALTGIIGGSGSGKARFRLRQNFEV